MLQDTNLAVPLVTLVVSLLKINRATYIVSTIRLNLKGDKLPVSHCPQRQVTLLMELTQDLWPIV